MANEKVASERVVMRHPMLDDDNAGVIVAAGDPLPPEFASGLIMNTPNKVDAAANYDQADAADKATNARPATITVQEGSGPSSEIVERVAENRNAWEQESRTLGEMRDRDSVPTRSSDDSTAATDDTSQRSASDMTVSELDDAYGAREGYPKSGSKADKVAFAERGEA